MSVQSVLARGRAAAEARMTSTATIYRQNLIRTTQDESTGREVPAWDVVAAEVPFRLGGSAGGRGESRTVSVAGTDFSLSVRTGHFPAGSARFEDNDFVDVTSGENAGQAYRIVESDWQDQATAYRVPLTSVTRPTEWP